MGRTTRQAISRLRQGVDPEHAGMSDENSNGNGSLMRILPVGLRYCDSSIDELLNYAHRASSLTHRHIRSQIACGFYRVLVAELLSGFSPNLAYMHAMDKTLSIYQCPPFLGEISAYGRVYSGEIATLPESRFRSSGYVVHTLEASLWCLINFGSFEEAVLAAVNLGEDTDTTATVLGGLAGVHYGFESIPNHWVDQLAKKEDLHSLFQRFIV